MYKYNKYYFLILIILILKKNTINFDNFKYKIINKQNVDFILFFFNNLIFFLKKENNNYYQIILNDFINIVKFLNKKNLLYSFYKKKFFKLINFANINYVDLLDLKINEDTYYSITNYSDAMYISNLIYKIFNTKNLIITDATANVGGNTISFGLFKFKKIFSVEINKKCYNYLNHNLSCYKINNVKTINNNYIKIYKLIKQDVVFLDPPWGGPNYKNKNNINLYLDYTNVNSLINDILNFTDTKAVILKAPFNYNFNGLTNILDKSKITINKYSLNKFFIILIHKNNLIID